MTTTNEPVFKCFHVSYRWVGGWGAYEDIDCIVITETASKAIGWVCQTYPETDSNPQFWSAEEIPLNKEGCTQIASASS